MGGSSGDAWRRLTQRAAPKRTSWVGITTRIAEAAPLRAPHDTIDEWSAFASTTEALTLTILTELLRRTREHPEVPDSVSVIFDGVYAAELDHWLFTSRHWDGFFGGEGDALDLAAVGRGVVAGEHLFVNTYLLGVTTFAAAGRSEIQRTPSHAAITPTG
jgi:hypothetical protein